MMSSNDILEILEEEYDSYKCQDNIYAASIANVLKRIIDQIKGEL